MCLGACGGPAAVGRVPLLLAAEAQAEPRWVELSGDVDKDLEQLLSELLGRSGLTLTWSAPSSEGRVIARVHVKLHDDGALLDVVDPRDTSAARQVSVPRHGTEALFRETLAHVILGNVDPLATLDAERPSTTPSRHGSPTPTVPKPAPPPASPVAAPAVAAPAPQADKSLSYRQRRQEEERLRFAFGVGGAALLVARDRAAPVMAGSLGLVFPGALQPRAALSAGYMPPLGIDGKGLTANFRLIPMRARLGLEPWSSPWLALDAALSLGVDWLTFTPTDTTAELQASSSTRVAPVLGALLGARAHLGAGLDATLGLGLDFDPTPRTWLVAEGERRVPVLEMLRFRPSAALGLEWTLPSERVAWPREMGAR
ncbi:MAG TPA: hypothetical protein VIK01_02690 [Polyangiaceae bacterium]